MHKIQVEKAVFGGFYGDCVDLPLQNLQVLLQELQNIPGGAIFKRRSNTQFQFHLGGMAIQVPCQHFYKDIGGVLLREQLARHGFPLMISSSG
ncbi:hypothetical protein TDB9533_01688 [Thalassocella blandensis]|nr:hypothetical protein TDB9533_01688 [Thalassocella blandensis]